jgi:hypothetical protein
VLDHFTREARRALTSARAEATTLGHREVVMAHVLVALLGLGDPRIDDVLGELVSVDTARDRVREAISNADGTEPDPAAPPARTPFATSLKRVLRALDEESADGSIEITPVRLAVSLLLAGNPLVDGIVRGAGGDEEEVAERLRADARAEASTHADERASLAPPALPTRSRGASAATSSGPISPAAAPAADALPSRGDATRRAASEPEPEPAAAVESEPAVPVESEPAVPVESEPAVPVEPEPVVRALPPPRPIAPDALGARSVPHANESLNEAASTLARSIGLAAALGLLVYLRTARRARRKAARTSRAQHVVIR